MKWLGSQLVALQFIIRHLRDELKILVFYHKILTGCIYYNEQEYKQDSVLTSE